MDDRGILSSVFYASAKDWSSMSAVNKNKCSSNLFIEAHLNMHVTFDLYRLEERHESRAMQATKYG